MEITIKKAAPADAQRLAEVYNLSFYSDYLKYGECPGYGKTEQKILDGMRKRSLYKIITEDTIVGAISVQELPDHQYYLGALCVIPEYANKGIGQSAMKYLDEVYSDAVHWALVTPTDKSENHYFYKKFGYQVTRECMDGKVSVSYFERGK